MASRKTAPEQLEGIEQFLLKMQRDLVPVTSWKYVLGLAQKVSGRVSTKYREYSSNPSATARSAIEQGKEFGAVNPARTPREHQDIFQILAAHVRPYGNKRTGYTVSVGTQKRPPNEHPRYPDGVPLFLLSYWIENPRPIKYNMTVRQIAYLNMVRRGQAGPGKRRTTRPHMPDLQTKVMYIYVPPDRPVWRAVAKELNALAKKHFNNPYFRLLRKIAQAYGAK